MRTTGTSGRKEDSMNSLEEQLAGVRSVVIAGHIRPDGDCTGSCLATYNYLKTYHPEIEAKVCLEPVPNKFKFLSGADEIISAPDDTIKPDLLIVQDCADAARLGGAAVLMERAKRVICIDHHFSNAGFGDDCYIFPKASSTSELVFELLPKERITKPIAECLYTGILNDTGMFQYSCTSSKTMRAAGVLMDTGIDFSDIAHKTFVQKTYEQNLILARAIEKSSLHLDGKCISTVITRSDMKECGVLPKHLDGIVSQLRATKGVEAAIFFYEKEPDEGSTAQAAEYKISLRSGTDAVNVAEIAMGYGGGGHVRAAGASIQKQPRECLDEILEQIKAQLEKHA